MLFRFLLLVIAFALFFSNQQAHADELPEIPVFTAGMQRQGGFLPVYWDDATGKVYLEVARFGDDFLFLSALESGLGSNPVGLDRGQLGDSVVCRWRRVGRRVFLEQQNLKFRAEGAPNAERRAVADSFAPSILWAGDMAAKEGASALVDVTSLVLSDRHGIKQTLGGAEQGDYSLDVARSLPVAESFAAFPDNTELPAMLTFSSSKAGSQVSSVAANGQSFTLRQRLSFVRLPDAGYQRRPFDPRIGSLKVSFADYAVPLDQSIFQALMVRHRLELNSDGTVREPIVYYVDSAAPEPIRTALVEGATWWTQAIEAAGFPGGFKVEVAPEGMDPLDIRFNFIQWVHRQTRGWSYGSSVTDPRTGEILKGHVSLGSLRVRQDRLLIENLITAQSPKPGAACGVIFPASQVAIENTMERDQAIELSLARIRQLSAHEVGHTLGIAHNFAASTYGDRASVMDYPAPRIKVDAGGDIDASDAYAVGMGVWDMRTIDYMYRSFADVPAWKAYADQKLSDDIRDGILYISDSDARPLGGAHPLAHLWDNGSDPIAELDSTLQVRQVAMKKFDPSVLLGGEPQGELLRAFTPLYFYHRFQTEAVVKMIGGVDYAYSFPGDANATQQPVSVEQQRRAITALMKTIDAETLMIEPRILSSLIPASSPTAWSNEEPTGFMGLIFDPLATAETAAATTVSAVLHPARMARLATQHTTLDGHPGVELVLQPLTTYVQDALISNGQDHRAAIGHRVASTIVNEMIQLASDGRAREDVRAQVRSRLSRLSLFLAGRIKSPSKLKDPSEAEWNADKIQRFLARPDISSQSTEPKSLPPGSPIGSR